MPTTQPRCTLEGDVNQSASPSLIVWAIVTIPLIATIVFFVVRWLWRGPRSRTKGLPDSTD